MAATSTLKTATRDGVNLRYVDTGGGVPALFFVHGWCCNLTHWSSQIDEFAPEHRVIAVDLRGHGESDKPDQDYTIGGFVDDLAWFIQQLEADRPIFVGHSMGGCIGLNFAHQHPELIRGLVMIDSLVVPPAAETQAVVDAIRAGFASPTYRQTAATFVRDFMFDGNSDPALRDEVVAGMAVAPQRLMHTAIASMLSEENLPAGTVPVPSLYIRAASQINSPEEISGRCGGLPVAEVDCAHFVQMERPEETNAIIRGFLEELP